MVAEAIRFTCPLGKRLQFASWKGVDFGVRYVFLLECSCILNCG